MEMRSALVVAPLVDRPPATLEALHGTGEEEEEQAASNPLIPRRPSPGAGLSAGVGGGIVVVVLCLSRGATTTLGCGS